MSCGWHSASFLWLVEVVCVCRHELAHFLATCRLSPPALCFVYLLVPDDQPFRLPSGAGALVLPTRSLVKRLCLGLSHVLDLSLTPVGSRFPFMVSYLWAGLVVCPG